jgi:WD40 repeat protein
MNAPPSSDTSVAARPSSPYKGLAPFEDSELDELLFFGRERDRAVIAANLVAARLTVLYGTTGVGKSSVLRAGVARDLRALPERPLVVVHEAWADDPVGSLSGAIAAGVGLEPGTLSETVEVAAALRGDVYLLLDQLEAYFVYHGAEPALADGILELLVRPELPVHILVAIREDALARLDAFKGQLPGLLANRLRLDHLTRAAGRRAIVGPIERYGALVPEEEGLAVEPALVDAVLDGVLAGLVVQASRGRGVSKAATPQPRIETPYLQLVMQRLWEVERAEGSRVLQLRTLERLGGPGHIVEAHLTHALAALTPVQMGLAAMTFNQLVTPSGMKIAHGTRDLANYAHTSEEEIAGVLATLSHERILRPVGDGADGGYEIFHDVLADAVLAWRARFLAEQAVERERAAARRRHRRLVATVAVALAALAAMAAITYYALEQRNEARRSAADAQLQRNIALVQTRKARQAQTEAERQRNIALVQTRKARQAQTEAERQAAIAANAETQANEQANAAQRAQRTAFEQAAAARAARQVAEQQKNAANVQRKVAERQTKKATAATTRATKSKQDALREARIAEARRRQASTAEQKATNAAQLAQHNQQLAESARADALAAKKQAEANAIEARTREYAFNAQALLTSDPESSLRLALHAAQLEPSLGLVETTLRDALLATRGLRRLPGGGGRVQDAEFSPDGSRVVIADGSGARVFDTGTSGSVKGTRLLGGSGGPVRLLATGAGVRTASFSHDGRTIVTAGSDGRAMLWDAAGGTLLHTLVHSGSLLSAVFSHDDRLLATTGTDDRAKLWDTATGHLLLSLAYPAPVLGAAFNPDATRVVIYGNDRAARVFDVTSGAQLLSLDHEGDLTSATYSRDGNLIATTARDGTARLWNAADGTLVHTLQARGNVLAAAFSPDGQWLATVGTDGVGRVWSVAGGELQTLLAGYASAVDSVAWSPDGQLIITAGTDGTARLWSFPDGTQQVILRGHTGAVVRVSFAPSGATAVTASDDGTARIWDARVDGSLRGVDRHAGAATGVAFSPDGKTLASSGVDGTLRLLALGAHTGARTIVAGKPLEDVAFSRDGHLLATAGADGTARVWSYPRGVLVDQIQERGFLNAVDVSPDGTLLALAGRANTAWIAPVAGGASTALSHPAPVLDVAFSPDGRLLATACGDGLARLWQVSTGELVRTLSGHTDDVTSVAFSPDGKLLVTASRDHDARIWDVAGGRMVRLLHGHAGSVSDAQFSADGRWVVTAGPVKAGVWATAATDLALFRLVFLAGHVGPIDAAAFAPQGWLLATAGSDGSVRTYTCALCGDTPQLEALARQRLAALDLAG